jgi:hypothetical protein
MKNITRAQFLKAYNTFPETPFLQWTYRNFNSNISVEPKPVGTIIAVLSWFLATIGIIIGDQTGNKDIANASIFFYAPFVFMFLVAIPAFFVNRVRIRKIADLLGVSLEDYNKLADKYQ